ncbi:MAG: Ig-like domain-containing protein [Nocardioides sp.]
MHTTPLSPLRRLAAAAVGGLLTVGLVAAPSVAAHATDDAVATGSDWTITEVAGGYQVTKALDGPLPVVGDVPVLTVDDTVIGLATESADGELLSVITTDDVSDATRVDVGWSTGTDKADPANAKVSETGTPVESLTRSELRALMAESADDGSTPGTYAYLEDDYDFGDQAIDLANIGGIRGEMTGRMYLPTTGGPRPTVILLHGRHSYCTVPSGGGSVSNPNRWPCIAPQVDIPSYKGYEGLGQTLATHGYAVLSISVNAINANDNQLASDYGAQARGQTVLDTLAMLEKANAGAAVSYYDSATARDVTLDEALLVDTAPADLGSTPTSGTNPGEPITAADLVGRFDLTNVGLMGHSRGGEGVVSAVNLNQALDEPFGITSVLPLAPVDFGRETVVDTDMLVILPYCDGDVSNQQGQHFSDDSRYAFDDDSLRSTLWVMGANHNFFNTVWTPGKYSLSVSDDWGSTSSDAVCGPRAETNLRLSDDEQDDVGIATMSAWFRLTMGDEDAFLPMFDGSVDPELTSVPEADLWTQATAPSSDRADIETFTATSGRVRLYGSGTANTCASAGARTLPQSYQACATASTVRSTSGMPHWTPASFAPNAPASPMTKFVWTSVSGTSAASVRVTVPKAERDASGYDMLTFKTAPDESVVTGTDLTLTVVDGAGATWSSAVSALNAGAVNRLPSSTSTTLNKIVLQQVAIPVATLAESIDVSDVREVRIAGATGADATASGGAYLSDLAFARSATGTTRGLSGAATVNVSPTSIEEGSGIDEAQAAAVLSAPVDHEVSAWFTLIGSTGTTSKAALAVQEVTFAPGETCAPVTFTTYGNTDASSSATTSYKMSVVAPEGAIVGADQFGWLRIREDDGLTTGTPAPEVGAQGDVCAEHAEASVEHDLDASVVEPAPGGTVVLTAEGFRSGESVTFVDGDTELGAALADPAGVVSYEWGISTDAALGQHPVVATGAGSARTASTVVSVLAPTETALGISPEAPAIKEAVTLTATVTGDDTAGAVEFLDGTTSLGTAEVVEGTATLTVTDGFLAGEHSLSAVFGQTETADDSTSNVVAFTLTKGVTTTVVELSAASTTYGTGATGTVVVGDAATGEVSVTLDGVEQPVSEGTFSLPAALEPGTYEVVATYAGSDLDEPSTSSVGYRVTKAGSRTTLTAPAKGTSGKKVTVSVKIAGVTNGAAPGGAVVVKLAGKKVATATVPASGKVTRQVKLNGSGSKKIKVTYSGDARYQGSSATKKVKVTKK